MTKDKLEALATKAGNIVGSLYTLEKALQWADEAGMDITPSTVSAVVLIEEAADRLWADLSGLAASMESA